MPHSHIGGVRYVQGACRTEWCTLFPRICDFTTERFRFEGDAIVSRRRHKNAFMMLIRCGKHWRQRLMSLVVSVGNLQSTWDTNTRPALMSTLQNSFKRIERRTLCFRWHITRIFLSLSAQVFCTMSKSTCPTSKDHPNFGERCWDIWVTSFIRTGQRGRVGERLTPISFSFRLRRST